MINVLITGSSGFVGQNLIKYLPLTEFKVHVVKRFNSKSIADSDKEFTWKHLNANSFNSINAIIHLAGKAHDLKNFSDPQEYFAINTELTKTIFNSFLQSTAKDFIYFSSVKSVADNVDGVLYEDVVPNPQTAYGQSKQKAEEYLLSQNLPEGKRLFILRPCMIHGPGNKGNLNLLYKFVQRRIPYPLAAFNNQRSFLSISNLNFIIERLISNPNIPGGVYNVADDETLSTNTVINIIAQTCGLKPKLWKLNPSLIKSVALMGDKLHLPLDSERLKKLTESYVVSNGKIKNVLNINHLPVSSSNGLIATIKSFSNQKST